MTLKNKNGSLYQLNKPNPLSTEQELWELEQQNYTLHNCEWENANIPQGTTQEIIKIPTKPDPPPKPIEPVIIEDLPPPPPIATPEPKKLQIPDSVRNKMVMFWCVPVTVKKVQDNLYGDTYNKTVFGEKFSFEGVVLEKQDLSMTFWTTVSQVVQGSIVFPSKYVNVNENYDDYRWWKVQSIKEKSPGMIMYCVTSEITPDFTGP